MGNKRSRLYLVLFFVLLFIEVAFQTFGKNALGNYTRPIVYLIISLLYLFIGIKFSLIERGKAILSINTGISSKYLHYVTYFVLSIFIYFVWTEYTKLISSNPLDPLISDVIPAMQIYVKRFVNGESVYRVMHFPSWDVHPNYLTLMWFPYVIPELLGIDYRLFSFGLFIILVIGYFIYIRMKVSENIFGNILVVSSILILFLLIKNDPDIFTRTLELTIAVFYIILAWTILSKKRWIIALGILLCLLSRYTLSFWLVSYVLIILFERGWKDFIIVNLYILIGVVLMFLPFIIHNPNIFIEGLKNYNAAARGEWRVHDWQKEGESPFSLIRGFGFAIYFYDFLLGDVHEKLKTLQLVHFIISLLSGLSIFAVYFISRMKKIDLRLFLMFGLKVFIMIFFNFIQVPYSYLFLVPLFLLIPIIGELIITGRIILSEVKLL